MAGYEFRYRSERPWRRARTERSCGGVGTERGSWFRIDLEFAYQLEGRDQEREGWRRHRRVSCDARTAWRRATRDDYASRRRGPERGCECDG